MSNDLSPTATKEQNELLAGALTLARSDKASDQAKLLKWLESGPFLDKLDTEVEVRNRRFRIRVEKIVETLAANQAPAAHQTIIALTSSPAFLQEMRRVDALITASAAVRPAPLAIVRFWDNRSQPDDGFSNLTIAGIVENGSPGGIVLFEHKVLDPRFDSEEKLAWFHSAVVSHRNDAPLLAGCERLLAGHLDPALKSALIDSLFDYRPDEWYGEVKVYTPPDRAKASPEALAILQRIATFALTKLNTTKRQEDAIESATGLTKKKLQAP